MSEDQPWGEDRDSLARSFDSEGEERFAALVDEAAARAKAGDLAGAAGRLESARTMLVDVDNFRRHDNDIWAFTGLIQCIRRQSSEPKVPASFQRFLDAIPSARMDEEMTRSQREFWYKSPDAPIYGKIEAVPARAVPMETPGDAADSSGIERCWYCRSGTPARESAAKVKMYGDVRIADVKTTATGMAVSKKFKILEVPIPRCPSCREVHDKRGKLAGALMLAASLGLIGTAVFQKVACESAGSLMVTVVGAFIAGALGHFIGNLIGNAVFTPAVPAEDSDKEHPMVLALIEEGWKIGDQPTQSEGFPKTGA